MKPRNEKILVWGLVLAMWFSFVPAFYAAGQGTQGHIWLNCDPGDRARGPGWQAGGFICTPGEYAPNAVLNFDLIVINRDKDDQTDLRIAMAIHSLNPPTTTDDLASLTVNGVSFVLADFGTSEFNPFDESYGGRHHVYSGSDAIWDIYHHAPGVVLSGETIRLPVEVVLGPDPSPAFEIHFDAFDMDTGAKSPNGHDVTLVSAGEEQPGDGGPLACIGGGDAITVFEGDLVTFDASCSSHENPDRSIVSYEWDFDTFVDSDGDGDTANDVDATGVVVSFTWYDDYESAVLLTVTDDIGQTGTAVQTVTVLNVDPTAVFDGAFIEFELRLRVAGEKWHNVNLDVHKNYNATTGASDGIVASLEVERWPGPPDANPTAGGPSIPVRVAVNGTDTYTAVITYDPFADDGDAVNGDQPINGQVWGSNPVWLIMEFPDDTTCRLFHNFNVRQSLDRDRDTPKHFAEPWIVDLTLAAAAGVAIEFVGSATDPGTDDITFTWDFGDGTVVSNMYLYDAARGPDPAFPPGSPYEPYAGGVTPPLSLTDTVFHTYGSPGTYTVTLTVSDDDGGFAILTFDITVEDSLHCP